MRDFNSYLPEDAIEENLKENSGRIRALSIQESAHLQELAEEIFGDFEERDDWLNSLPDRSTILQSEEGEIHTCRRAVELSRRLAELIRQKKPPSLSFYFPDDGAESVPRAEKGCRVAYQRSTYADEAYLRFSAYLEDPRVSYSHSFISACEDVYNGISHYCILPVESTSDGHLGSFARLIHRYELKIVATCDIMGNDADRSTRYALLGRSVRPLLPPPQAAHFFEFSLPLSSEPSIASVLLAADHVDMELCRINCLPGQGFNGVWVHFLLRIGQTPPDAFLIYLFMQAPHFTPIGIYNHL